MGLAVSGTKITEDGTTAKTVVFHENKDALKIDKKHIVDKSFQINGRSLSLGGVENKLITISGTLIDENNAVSTLSADQAKLKLETWQDAGTTVYIRSTLLNDTNTYSGVDHTVSGTKYLPVKILELEFSIQHTDVSKISVTIKLEEVI